MFTAALPIAYAMTSDYREAAAVPLCPLRDIRPPSSFKLQRCWLLTFTPVTYLSKLLGTLVLAA
ncbi:hypothetical protein AM470_00850 [Serratia marcescens]|nr:hypothetical protein AM470_00850 [Serratia marcescens]